MSRPCAPTSAPFRPTRGASSDALGLAHSSPDRRGGEPRIVRFRRPGARNGRIVLRRALWRDLVRSRGSEGVDLQLNMSMESLRPRNLSRLAEVRNISARRPRDRGSLQSHAPYRAASGPPRPEPGAGVLMLAAIGKVEVKSLKAAASRSSSGSSSRRDVADRFPDPAERDLAEMLGASRPVVHEAWSSSASKASSAWSRARGPS